MNAPFRARMINDEAEGTTATCACRFWMVSWTVTRRPFQSPVAFAISSPTFFGACFRQSKSFEMTGKEAVSFGSTTQVKMRHTKPNGPTFGASADEAPTSPPVARR
jgi:hypothetical protein